MKTLLILLTLIAGLAATVGCQALNQTAKGFQSQVIGIHRRITLFDYNGRPIGSWRSNTVIDIDSSQQVTFFDSTGARILTHGGILVAEENR